MEKRRWVNFKTFFVVLVCFFINLVFKKELSEFSLIIYESLFNGLGFTLVLIAFMMIITNQPENTKKGRWSLIAVSFFSTFWLWVVFAVAEIEEFFILSTISGHLAVGLTFCLPVILIGCVLASDFKVREEELLNRPDVKQAMNQLEKMKNQLGD
jgi:prolipoprotein diacylglyceryltransferase